MAPLDLETVRRCVTAHTPREIEGPESWAAVSMTLRDGPDGPEVFLIRRSEHPDDPWSGHMAFPGGRKDDIDETLLATAHRETLEEVGLSLIEDADALGRLDDLQAVARGGRGVNSAQRSVEDPRDAARSAGRPTTRPVH